MISSTGRHSHRRPRHMGYLINGWTGPTLQTQVALLAGPARNLFRQLGPEIGQKTNSPEMISDGQPYKLPARGAAIDYSTLANLGFVFFCIARTRSVFRSNFETLFFCYAFL